VLGFEGEHLGIVGFGIVAVFLLFVPFLATRAPRQGLGRAGAQRRAGALLTYGAS
jgi:hypothetical protein